MIEAHEVAVTDHEERRRGQFPECLRGPPGDLDVAEAALLAGLVKSPSTYAPTINLERAVARRNVVLQSMRDTSVIDRATYEHALRSQPHLVDALRAEETYGLYFKVARTFVRAIGNPAVMRELTRVGFQSRTLMEWILRIMANLLRPDELGPAEAVYKTVAAMVAVAPEP